MSEVGENPVVLVTGGAKRIGAAIAEKFHGWGYRVIIHCNNSRQQADNLAGLFNDARQGSATVLQANLCQDQEVDQLAGQARQAFGRLDVLVNNASGFYPTPLGTVEGSHWEDLINSNLRGAFFLSQALAAELRDRNGAIVNLLDIYVERPLQNYPVYSIAKAGLQAMTRSLAIELAPQVRVNAVAPGAILWPEQEQDETATAAHEALLSQVPLGRKGNPVDIAEAVFFLAAQASYMTGDTIRVDGGRRLNL